VERAGVLALLVSLADLSSRPGRAGVRKGSGDQVIW